MSLLPHGGLCNRNPIGPPNSACARCNVIYAVQQELLQAQTGPYSEFEEGHLSGLRSLEQKLQRMREEA